MRCSLFLSSLLIFSSPCAAYGQAERHAALTSPEERAALHRSADWEIIVPHLPNPDTATAAMLETAGDVLRARRFPEDSLDYYGYAMARGGNVSELLNKMGVVRLELRQTDLARQMFLRTVKVQKRNAVAWNNLGVTEYSTQNYRAAISDYQRAAKLDKRSAVYHSNLGMAYFEANDMESARAQFAAAIKLDPSILQGDRDGSGSVAHVLGTTNYGSLSFQMAELYAREKKPVMVKLWLAKAAEAGFDVRGEMKGYAALVPYLHDPEVLQMLSNAAQLRDKHLAKNGAIPSLGNAQPLVN